MGKPIGLQLYPFREALAADFERSLARIADMGYVAVEFLGLQGHSPESVAPIVDKLGLRVCASHVSPPTEETVESVVEEARVLQYTMPVANTDRATLEAEQQVRETAAHLQRAAALLKERGLRFALHNHWWEFRSRVGGRFAYDVIMEQAPDLYSELDVYWAAYGGNTDAVEVVAAYRDRIPLLHVKDGTLEDSGAHTPVGSGALDIPAIIAATDPNVVEWLIVDLLEDPEADMFESARESYRYLTAEGLAEGRG
jgi:sugar phosphate isomerase/epimerase